MFWKKTGGRRCSMGANGGLFLGAGTETLRKQARQKGLLWLKLVTSAWAFPRRNSGVHFSLYSCFHEHIFFLALFAQSPTIPDWCWLVQNQKDREARVTKERKSCGSSKMARSPSGSGWGASPWVFLEFSLKQPGTWLS